MITHLIFDLDETLYSPETGLLQQIDRRVDEFLQKKLNLDRQKTPLLRKEYYERFGTTLRGVHELHGIAPEEYCHYVYSVAVNDFLAPDPALRRILEEIPACKVVFSNSPRGHIERVLAALGIRDCFRELFDIHFSNCLGKPHLLSYRLLLAALKSKGENCLFLDDRAGNLAPARDLGMRTVLVNKKYTAPADFWIPVIHRLPAVWARVRAQNHEITLEMKRK